MKKIRPFSRIREFIYWLLAESRFARSVGRLLPDTIPTRFGRLHVPGNCTPEFKCSLLFGLYEYAENRMIRKHLSPSIPCIELGGSMGYITNAILSKLDSTTALTVVEASPDNTVILEKNIRHFLSQRNITVTNAAISYGENSVFFAAGDNNLSGKIGDSTDAEIVKGFRVQALKLGDVALSSSDYSLVMDIEGAEYELIGDEALANCVCIIAELHGNMERKQTMIDHLAGIGLGLIERKHSVFVFQR